LIGVIADDFTGANDIGIMFAKNDYKVLVYSVYENPGLIDKDADVIILNTNSRLDSSDIAYRKAAEATRVLKELGCTMFHKKTCSVFRGNIGAEFDGMMDELKAEFCPVILGFPSNGRTTRQGVHYVNGVLLEDAPFKHDPVHPMLESDLVRILQKQTSRKVGLIGYDVVKEGVRALKAALANARRDYQYVILDVLDQSDLNTIAGAVKDETAIAGSSAIGEELPKWLPKKGRGSKPRHFKGECLDAGTLIVSGSVTPQTCRQVKAAKEKGYAAFSLTADKVFDIDRRDEIIDEYASWILDVVKRGEGALMHSENDPESIRKTKQLGVERGMDEIGTGRLISSMLSDITAKVLVNGSVSRLIVLGGETSGTICDSLGIIGNIVLEEIEPGVPSVLSIGKVSILMAPKSGSFGSDDFVHKADVHLKMLQGCPNAV